MPQHHVEIHKASSENLRDFVIGMSDGLTVPFALAAGLSGAVDSTTLIITAGLAEIAAGTIAMGLGGYLGAKTEADHYDSEYKREVREVELVPHVEAREVGDILRGFGVPDAQVPVVVDAIMTHPEKWVDFMMRFELGLEKPDPRRRYLSPALIGGAYALGGLIPLMPYILTNTTQSALVHSSILTLIALAGFGAFKGHYTGMGKLRSALQTLMIGALAAATAFSIARLIS